MSRRPNDKAAANQQTIKSLLKLEGNKFCADCKRNKHPRWASWNLGIFICIRCSGIHRGMGTHISRVKSVDLDAWTDEQLQSVLRWGNARANKYWESKLAPGHVPSEAKIENFIRTKYESKRWVMDGPMPDPSTLEGDDAGDDNVPLNVVQERARVDRASSQRLPAPPPKPPASARSAEPIFDLMGGDDLPAPPARPSTTDAPAAAASRPPPAKSQQTPSQLLGGLDFFGTPPDRPASASSKSTGMSRPDLKQSILSLYSTAPKAPPQQPQQPQHDKQPSFGGMQSSAAPSSNAFGGLNDAFSGLNFGSSANVTSSQPPPPQQQQQQQRKSSGFSGFDSFSSAKSTPAAPQMTSPPPLSGGGFFDAGPKPPAKPAAPPKQTIASSFTPGHTQKLSDGFGDFSTVMSSAPPPPKATSSNSGLLDFTTTPLPGADQMIKPSTTSTSVFNLSASKPTPSSTQPAPSVSSLASTLPADPWASNEWADPAPAPKATQTSAITPVAAASNDFGWGSSTSTSAATAAPVAPSNDWGQSSSTAASNFGANSTGGWGGASDNAFGGMTSSQQSQPKIAADEDFGGWSAAAVPTPTSPIAPVLSSSNKPPAAAAEPAAAPKSFGGVSEDLFSNVWG